MTSRLDRLRASLEEPLLVSTAANIRYLTGFSSSNATLLVFPSIDSIQEFRVERNSFSAEYGQAQGAVINLITKGGTVPGGMNARARLT